MAEYGVTLKIEEIENSEYEVGTITYQSRPEGYVVASGGTLTIRVVKEPSYTDEECKENGTC